MSKRQHPINNSVLSAVVLILVVGSLGLAILDKNYRSTFADLAKVGVGSYIGWMIPKFESKRES